jgi:hypothetical protein
VSTLGRAETERLMARVRLEAQARKDVHTRARLEAWLADLEEEVWRARAALAVGAPYDHAALNKNVDAFRLVLAWIEEQRQ